MDRFGIGTDAQHSLYKERAVDLQSQLATQGRRAAQDERDRQEVPAKHDPRDQLEA